MKRILLPVAGLIVLASAANAQVITTKAGYLLRTKYVKGMTIKFVTKNSVSGPKGTPMAGSSFSMPMTMQILDVVDGFAKVKLILGKIMVNGTVIRQEQSAQMMLDNRNSGAESGAQNVATQYPKGAVKVGQSWTAVAPVKSEAGVGKMDARYTFAGLKTVNGKPVAVINYTLKGYASGTGKMIILASDGTLYSNQVQMRLMMGGPDPLVVTSSLTRA